MRDTLVKSQVREVGPSAASLRESSALPSYGSSRSLALPELVMRLAS